MFRWLTKTKSGFTLVELMVVVLLLSLGFVALANITSSAYRAFEKSAERRIKQEAVKNLAEVLQKSTHVGAANSADIFDDINVVPTAAATDTVQFDEDGFPVEEIPSGGEPDGDYSYLYSKYGVTPDGQEGYFLFHLKKGAAKAECLNPDIPLYIEFKPCKLTQEDIDSGKFPGSNTVENQVGIEVAINALENDFVYVDSETNALNPLENEDDVYYMLNVTYHFPNMIASGTTLGVNKNAGGQVSQAEIYDKNGHETTNLAQATNDGGCVFRCSADSIITGDSSSADVTSQSFCFIATASYGHDSGEVGLLCDFRDKCLLTNPLGTAFVKAYYKLSPPIADVIAKSEPLKATVRVALKPLIIVAENALDEDLARQSLPWFMAFMCCGAGATAMLIRITKKKKRQKSE